MVSDVVSIVERVLVVNVVDAAISKGIVVTWAVGINKDVLAVVSKGKQKLSDEKREDEHSDGGRCTDAVHGGQKKEPAHKRVGVVVHQLPLTTTEEIVRQLEPNGNDPTSPVMKKR